MEKSNDIHLVYKKLGDTPNEAVLRFKKENKQYENESITYAGRLDPMAEGLLLLLSGEALLEKEKYLNFPKTYEFEILWGFDTDSLDILGKPESFKVHKVEVESLEGKLKESVGKFSQIYPAYSSKPVLGKPLFQWARGGKIGEIDIPKHEVEIFKAEYLGRRNISKEELIENIKYKINLVKGDFRQKEILEGWNNVITDAPNEFFIDKIYIKVSSGFYIRQFVKDLADSLQTRATTFYIKRISIGEYCL